MKAPTGEQHKTTFQDFRCCSSARKPSCFTPKWWMYIGIPGKGAVRRGIWQQRSTAGVGQWFAAGNRNFKTGLIPAEENKAPNFLQKKESAEKIRKTFSAANPPARRRFYWRYLRIRKNFDVKGLQPRKTSNSGVLQRCGYCGVGTEKTRLGWWWGKNAFAATGKV